MEVGGAEARQSWVGFGWLRPCRKKIWWALVLDARLKTVSIIIGCKFFLHNYAHLALAQKAESNVVILLNVPKYLVAHLFNPATLVSQGQSRLLRSTPNPHNAHTSPPQTVIVCTYLNFPPSNLNSWLSVAFIMCSHRQNMLTDPKASSITYRRSVFGA